MYTHQTLWQGQTSHNIQPSYYCQGNYCFLSPHTRRRDPFFDNTVTALPKINKIFIMPPKGILRNLLREFLQIWHKRPLGLKDELIRFWWSSRSQKHF
uniref:Uncharacterized protein n=1 Tax=Anguilla anguilla TaxID=7936 RepID=A0A0E9XH25_ANGAN